MKAIDRLLYFFVRRKEAKAALLMEQARIKAQSEKTRLILRAMRDGRVIEIGKEALEKDLLRSMYYGKQE